MSSDAAVRQPRRSAKLRLGLAARGLLERTDELISLAAPKDRPGLLVLMFHCVFEDGAEPGDAIDPHERATPERLARLIGYLRGHGYRFVSAREIDAGLPGGATYAHLTFDDGFANNLALVDLLAREQAHATVFPSVAHVRGGGAYWWNVVYRERARRGQRPSVAAEYAHLRGLTSRKVDEYLLATFGPDALRPAGDVDRPLTVEELRQLAGSPWIEIGNHTMTHAILPNHSRREASEEIGGAQRWLEEQLGEAPFFIAYPNGNTSDAVVEVAREEGLRLGTTVASFRNRLPLGEEARMRIGRFRVVFDSRATARMRAVRSSVQLTGPLRAAFLGD